MLKKIIMYLKGYRNIYKARLIDFKGVQYVDVDWASGWYKIIEK